MSRAGFHDFVAEELRALQSRLGQRFDDITLHPSAKELGSHRAQPTRKVAQIQHDDVVKQIHISEDIPNEHNSQQATPGIDLSGISTYFSSPRKEMRLHVLDVDASVHSSTPLGEIATVELVNGIPSWIVGTLGALEERVDKSPYVTSANTGTSHSRSEFRSLTRMLSSISGNSNNTGHTERKSEYTEVTMTSLPSGTFVLRSKWTKFEDKSFLLMANIIRRSRQDLHVRPTSEMSGSLWLGKTMASFLYTSPAAGRRFMWDILGLILILYDLLTIPLRVFDPPDNIFMEVMVWVTQLFWSFDIIASFFVGVYIKGELVMKPKIIAHRYLTTWFPFDVFVVSVDWVLFALGQEDESSAGITRLAKGVRFVRFIRTLKLLRLMKMRHLLDQVQQHIYSEVASIQYSIAQLFLRIFIINHLLACFWYGIGTMPDDQGHSWAKVIEGKSFVYRYTTSLHWALTQLGVGNMDATPTNTAERIYAIAVLFLALFMFSSLVSSIVNLMARLQTMKDEETWQFRLVRRFCIENHVSKALTMRVQQFLLHAHERRAKRVHDGDIKIFGLLSEPLFAELRYERYAACLSWHPFFSRLMRKFAYRSLQNRPETRIVVHKVAKDALATNLYGSGDPIFCSSNVARYMFFLEEGECEYVKHCQAERVQPSQWVSEPVLWTPWLHLGTLTGVIESQFITFDSELLPEIMSMHPETWTLAHKYAQCYVQCLNRKLPDKLSDVDPDLIDRVWVGTSHESIASGAALQTTPWRHRLGEKVGLR